MTTQERTPEVGDFLGRLNEWREADAWLTSGKSPASDGHGVHDGRRWVEVDDERFTEEDIVWLRRSAVISSVSTLEGRTTWREWPEPCNRAAGPRPPERIDEIRMRLKVAGEAPRYLYCAAASDGPAGPVGTCELRTFRDGEDPSPPNDTTVVTPTTAEEQEDLFWLTLLTVREHLPQG